MLTRLHPLLPTTYFNTKITQVVLDMGVMI